MTKQDWQIDNLTQHAVWLDTVVQWHHSEWVRTSEVAATSPTLMADALYRRRQVMAEHLRASAVPSTFVAHIDGRPVGSVSLIHHNFKADAPRIWLTNLFVLPSHRRRGLGALLLSHAEAAALKVGLTQLHLYTFETAEYYLSRGWQLEGGSSLHGRDIDVLVKHLNNKLDAKIG